MEQKLTRHAQARMQQRGVRSAQMQMLLDLIDLELPVGRGLHALRPSRLAISQAQAEGLDGQAVDRLRRIVLVESTDGAIVTIARLHGRKAKAYSRRDRRKFWR